MKTETTSNADKDAWIWTLFGVVFVLGGLLIDFHLIRSFGQTDLHAEPLLFSVFVINNFLGVGVGLLFIYLARSSKPERRCQQLFPAEPWRWSAEWADGVSSYDPAKPAIGKSLIFLCVLGVFLPAIIATVFNPQNDALACCFNVGVAALVLGGFFFGLGVWTSVCRWLAQGGRSYFRFTTFPALTGDRLSGMLELPVTWPSGSTKAQLCCLKKTGSGKSARYHTLWEAEQAVITVTKPDGKIVMPVEFQLPETVEPTSDSASISWKLYAWSETSPKSFLVEFPVPVWSKTDLKSRD